MERDTNFSLAKQSKSTIPVQAETEAINWVTHQVVNHNIDAAIIKSDYKICVDALTKPSIADPWGVTVPTQDTLKLSSSTSKIQFKWTPRESNRAAHVLDTWSPNNDFSGCFVLGVLPLFFANVIEQKA